LQPDDGGRTLRREDKLGGKRRERMEGNRFEGERWTQRSVVIGRKGFAVLVRCGPETQCVDIENTQGLRSAQASME
jgi:hypothetical protein